MDSEIIKAAIEELTMAYMTAHKAVSEQNVNSVALNLCTALRFSSVSEVREAFRRSRLKEDVPTLRTLSDALGNLRAESYSSASSAPQIENRNPLEPWLPSETIKKRINLCTAMRNYCAAVGDQMYLEYIRIHQTVRGDGGHIRWAHPEKVAEFDAPVKDSLRRLYKKYWRKCACAAGYPEGELMNLGLSAPTVPEFKAMLHYESLAHI